MASLGEIAELVGRCRAVEFAGFEALGARRSTQDAPAAIFLAGASRAHGFRAGLLESCIPFAAGFAGGNTAPLPHEIVAVFEVICENDDDRAGVDALVEVFYPALRDAYEQLRGLSAGPGDTFVRRTFRRCRDDVVGLLEEARSLGPTHADGLRARRVRALLDEAGGPFGSLAEGSERGVAVSPGQAAGGAA